MNELTDEQRARAQLDAAAISIGALVAGCATIAAYLSKGGES